MVLRVPFFLLTVVLARALVQVPSVVQQASEAEIEKQKGQIHTVSLSKEIDVEDRMMSEAEAKDKMVEEKAKTVKDGSGLLELSNTGADKQKAEAENVEKEADEAKQDCIGVRDSWNAGFGGCEQYSHQRYMHKFCQSDFDGVQSAYAFQVCDECNKCSLGAASPARHAAVTKAYGDPHMQNVLGQRFDLMKPGHHTLVQIPKGASHQEVLLHVAAKVERLGNLCQDMYITQVNVTGAWPENEGSKIVQFQAGAVNRDHDGKWLNFGPIDIKIVHGTTMGDTEYLNFLVRYLTQAGYTVGGLLGEDDHTDASTSDGRCQRATMALLSDRASTVSMLQGGERTGAARSVAEAQIEETGALGMVLS